ncbi:MAG: hypothetical protein V4538_14130 [Bacteroidota bacterium]
MKFALEILKKHKEVCEINLNGLPGMIAKPHLQQNYQQNLRDLKSAIKLLETTEKIRQKGSL